LICICVIINVISFMRVKSYTQMSIIWINFLIDCIKMSIDLLRTMILYVEKIWEAWNRMSECQ